MEPWRVAQIVTISASEESAEAGVKRVLGSGFLVAPGIVLTAAHVLAGAAEVRVRLDVGQPAEISILADEWWADPAEHNGTDLGFVVIPAEKTAGRDVDPARFGRVSDGTAVLPVSAWGFPRHKLRSSTDSAGHAEIFRDLDDVRARTPVAANRRQGTLAVYLDGPLPAGDRPWEGMSGAAVWADGRIIGVLAEHHSAEGNGRLTARRIDRAYTELSAQHLDRLVTRLGLPAEANGLPDVIPVEPARLLQSAYLAQVLNIAPDTLADRENELADWVEFCSGRDGYAWWQGGPWTGKTALAAWFVTHPPDGVDVVSFFVTSRLAGQSDGSAFLDSMTEQLSALNPGAGRSSGARVGEWLSLLDTAARRATERGRRLVVVVDGLDEDQYAASPGGRPASPRCCQGVRRTMPCSSSPAGAARVCPAMCRTITRCVPAYRGNCRNQR